MIIIIISPFKQANKNTIYTTRSAYNDDQYSLNIAEYYLEYHYISFILTKKQVFPQRDFICENPSEEGFSQKKGPARKQSLWIFIKSVQFSTPPIGSLSSLQCGCFCSLDRYLIITLVSLDQFVFSSKLYFQTSKTGA